MCTIIALKVSSNPSESWQHWLPMPNFTTMDPVLVAIICAALVIVYKVYRRYTGISLTDVPGPVSPSFIMGTSPFVDSLLCWRGHQETWRSSSKSRQERLTSSGRLSMEMLFVLRGRLACVVSSVYASCTFWFADSQDDRLMISDPAALQYIYVKSSYRFPKQHDHRALSMMLNGKSVAWAEGRLRYSLKRGV